MQVIDGMHRVLVAKQMGHKTVQCKMFVGDEEDAFIEAVQANVQHGLPLTLADRTAAASRIVRTHVEWSDRRIASLVGLSPKTVGAIRTRSSEEIPQTNARVGVDGHLRRLPVRTFKSPSVTERDVAEAVEQPETGENAGGELLGPKEENIFPLQLASQIRRKTSNHVPAQAATAPDNMAAYQVLRRDPSFRMTEAGRFLLRLLDLHLVRTSEWNRLVTNVPSHQIDSVAALAQQCARAWLDLAARITIQGSLGSADRST